MAVLEHGHTHTYNKHGVFNNQIQAIIFISCHNLNGLSEASMRLGRALECRIKIPVSHPRVDVNVGGGMPRLLCICSLDERQGAERVSCIH